MSPTQTPTLTATTTVLQKEWRVSLGDQTRQWKAVVASSDFTTIIAAAACVTCNPPVGGSIHKSSDGVWSELADTIRMWTCLAISSDGLKLIGGTTYDYLYTSSDGGVSWLQRAEARNWVSVASSSSGTILVAAASGSFIYISSDSGETWLTQFTNAPIHNWNAVTMTANGTKMFAAEAGSGIYFSSDSGVNWGVANSLTTVAWNCIASSFDGRYLVASAGANGLYSSTTGAFVARGSGGMTISWVASSEDGTKMYASTSTGMLVLSTNYGVGWNPFSPSYPLSDNYIFAVSADGSKIVAAGKNGWIHTYS